ncbi:prefoldin subunit alpha [Candidatus Micrarchaeota archaeon RBG_16_36_9]|nr:MAG: prefoldin subunit alpha [Candidatus Micrarchaeota archaeon RBG_16_36_9]
MNEKEDVQKKIMEFQILDNNLKMLQERAEMVNQRLEDMHRTKVAIEDLKTTKPNKALIPLGSGNFVYGGIENCEDIIVSVGSDVVIKKKREKAIEVLDVRIKELESNLNTILRQSSAFVMQLEKIQQELESLQK